jgi:hypothetical protein
MEKQVLTDLTEFGNNCNAIELAAGQQTVRNLTLCRASSGYTTTPTLR